LAAGNAFADEELDQIIDAIGHKSTSCLLFLSRRISSFCFRCKYLQCCYACLVQGYTTIWSDRIFAQPGVGRSGPIEHDKHLASLGRDLDAETRTASVPVDNIL